MQLGMIGLGRMGANLVRRCMRFGHECVVYDHNPASVDALVRDGAIGATSVVDLVAKLAPPRAVWLMVPAGVTSAVLSDVAAHLTAGDTVIDGGNTHYADDIARSEQLLPQEIDYVDCGTSGGVWGLDRGFCLMIGGPAHVIARLDPIFRALAPGIDAAPRTPGRDGEPAPEELGYLHCGPAGAGHFVKMVHNGIEYGLMQAYAEGFDIFKNATSKDLPDGHRFELDLADIAELWRRGSVVSSWLLDLTASALAESPELTEFTGAVEDS